MRQPTPGAPELDWRAAVENLGNVEACTSQNDEMSERLGEPDVVRESRRLRNKSARDLAVQTVRAAKEADQAVPATEAARRELAQEFLADLLKSTRAVPSDLEEKKSQGFRTLVDVIQRIGRDMVSGEIDSDQPIGSAAPRARRRAGLAAGRAAAAGHGAPQLGPRVATGDRGKGSEPRRGGGVSPPWY